MGVIVPLDNFCLIVGYTWSKKKLKSNFRQYGQMKQQRSKKSEKRKEEEKKIKEEKESEERRSRCAERYESRDSLNFFQCFVAPGAPKVGLLKRPVRSHLVRREIQNCAVLWHKADLEVKMIEALHYRGAFGS